MMLRAEDILRGWLRQCGLRTDKGDTADIYITAAILAAREECAKVADKHGSDEDIFCKCGNEIAAAIRGLR